MGINLELLAEICEALALQAMNKELEKLLLRSFST